MTEVLTSRGPVFNRLFRPRSVVSMPISRLFRHRIEYYRFGDEEPPLLVFNVFRRSFVLRSSLFASEALLRHLVYHNGEIFIAHLRRVSVFGRRCGK